MVLSTTDSKPKLIEIVAKVATMIVGNRAIRVKTLVNLACNLDPEVRDLLETTNLVILMTTKPATIST